MGHEGELRRRNKAVSGVEGVTEAGGSRSRSESPKKEQVLGRTPDGIVFAVPHTEDVLTGLFDPRLPKSSLDLVTLFLLGSQILLWLWLPRSTSRILFMVSFAVWRLAYNAGLGYILTKQSKQRWIVNWFRRSGFLDENKHPKIKAWIQRQVTIKLGKDYDFDAHPVEYNVWVLFRSSVDVILLNDFLCYFLFGISHLTAPDTSDSKAMVLYLLRWVSGLTLIVFNLWVKMDAHRIITDLAWYWADAFFISLQNLVFDGVFEMAPHPMYSVGYAGYYGLSLIVGSETVLYVSLAAHACQFAFLVFFENPHIERVYGERKPIAMRKPFQQQSSVPAVAAKGSMSTDGEQAASSSSSAVASDREPFVDTPAASDNEDTDTDASVHRFQHDRRASNACSDSTDLDADEELHLEDFGVRSRTPVAAHFLPHSPTRAVSKPHLRSRHDLDTYYFRHDQVILKNFDPLRATDFGFAVAMFYVGLSFILPNLGKTAQIVTLCANALGWRLIHTFVLGNVLKAQSEKKWMVRHFLKHYHYEGTGFTAVEEAFNNWKSIYNMSLCMVYASFSILALRCYDWQISTELLRHVLGGLLLALHIWTSKAIYDTLGRFGWFYGDFFIQNDEVPAELAYTGIYRHVNNPERIMGGAAFFGIALISGSKLVGALAAFSVLSHFWFLSCVESPHMKRLYGNALRKEAGVTKTFRGVASKQTQRAPPQVQKVVQEFQGTIERVFDDTSIAVEDFLRKSGPKLTGYVENTKVLLKEQGERLLITRVTDVGDLDVSAYSLQLEPSELVSQDHKDSLPDLPRSAALPKYQLGEPIRVNWEAPADCTRKDWIGLYRLGGNKSKLVTRIRSHGRWHGIYPDEWHGDVSLAIEGASGSASGLNAPKKHGSLLYTDNRLFWQPGCYEFRYHHDGKHNVMTVSQPFEIIVDRPVNRSSYTSVYNTLLPLVTRGLNNDPSLVPESAYSLLSNKPDEETKQKIHHERTDPDDFVLYTNDQAERIAEILRESCGLELTKEVVAAEANVAKLARLVVDSTTLLKPFGRGVGG